MSSETMLSVQQMNELAAANTATAEQLAGMVNQLGMMLVQLDARMRAQEKLLQARVTVTHKEQLRLMAVIRARAGELCEQYMLPKGCAAALRVLIRKDVLARWKIRDLHDLPAASMDEAMKGIVTWESYSAIRALRTKMGV